MASSSKSTIRVKQPKELLAVEPENPPQCAVHVVEVNTNSTTTSPKLTSALKTSNSGCVMWIHLQASICTEWEHTSMVVSQQDKISGIVSIASLLQNLGKNEKRPKTIHRCILQKMTSLDTNSSSKRISCHVCGEGYESYKHYLDHLLNKSCEKKPDVEEVQIEAEIINGRKRAIDTKQNTDETLDGITDGFSSKEPSPKKIQYSSEIDKPRNEFETRIDVAKFDNDKLKVTMPIPRLESSHSITSNLCPHFAAATQQNLVPLQEFVADQTRMTNLKGQVTTLLAGLMGEEKLTSLGYPDKDVLIILKNLLEMARCQTFESNVGCTSVCDRLESILSPNQVKYRRLKCELTVAKLNIHRLLEICIPDKDVWTNHKWHEKSTEEILKEIVSDREGYVNNESHVGS